MATISIIADFATAVAGERIDVRTLVHVGGDPHSYDPTPADARLLADADLLLRNGLGLEPWLDPMLGGVGTDLQVVTLTEALTATVVADGPFAGTPDPHMWMDPALAGRYVERVRDAFSELDPAGQDEYARNARAYLSELTELDTWISGAIATVPPHRRKLVTTHDAFHYFGDRYGLEVVGTIWSVSTEREPSAGEIRVLVDAVRAHEVPVVFAETTINPRLMQRVAADADVHMGEPLYGDSVGEPGSGADSYIGMMRANARAIVKGLGGRTT